MSTLVTQALGKSIWLKQGRIIQQTVTLWERGVRKPGKTYLRWLSDFYGIGENWFGDLSDDDMMVLKEKKMYRHYDSDKEYFSFVPEVDGWAEISISCGELDNMLDERYADTLKKKKEFMQHVERFLEHESKNRACLFDKITVAERGMRDIESFISLMDTVQGVGAEGRGLKVPFRYEIKTALYAMMIVSGKYSVNEIKSMYIKDFEEGSIRIDVEYMDELVDVMRKHWLETKNREIEKSGRN